MFRSSDVLVLLLWSALLVVLPAAAATQEVLVNPQTPAIPVDHGVEVLIEHPGENLTRESVMQAELASRWTLHPRKMVNLLGERRPVWLRFSLRSTAQEERILSVGWPVVTEVRFFQYQTATGTWGAEYLSGLAHPEESRIRKDPNPNFPVFLKANEPTVVLLRVKAPTSVAVPMVLWEPKAWQAGRFDYLLGMGLFFGILGVMLFYNLSLHVFSKEGSYGLYSLYLFAVILYELCVTGLGPLLLWPGNHWLTTQGYEFFASTSFLAGAVFTRHFLRVRERAPSYLDWLSRGFIAFFTVVTLLLIFEMPVAVPLAMPVGGFFGAIAGICIAAYLAWHGDVLARYFVIAWAGIIGATTVLLMALAGLFEPGAWMIFVQPAGFVLETVLLSAALAERIKRERLSKEAALLESQKLAQQVQAAQEKALAVQLKANEELESRVRDRTADLNRAMDTVEHANRELAKLSVTDALTGVNNRRYFDETIEKEYDRSCRSSSALALLMIDIDLFKKINDTVGHVGGDECLRLVAETLSSCVGRSNDLVARYGGEEFAMLLPGVDGRQAMVIAERVRQAVEKIQFVYRGQHVPISVSLGVAARVGDVGRPIAEFIAEADEALYAAKHAGRNRVMLAEAA